MILIAHRGNISGPSIDENNPQLIREVLDQGYDAEIDVRYLHGCFWLGHDEPQYKVSQEFLMNNSLWCHAKNPEALQVMNAIGVPHYFWHQDDYFTLTSCNRIWTYPGQPLFANSIAVMPRSQHELLGIKNVYGICSDQVFSLK